MKEPPGTPSVSAAYAETGSSCCHAAAWPESVIVQPSGVVERRGPLLRRLHDRGDEGLSRHPLAVDVERLGRADAVRWRVHHRELRVRLAGPPGQHQAQRGGEQRQQTDRDQDRPARPEHGVEAGRPGAVRARRRRQVHGGLEGDWGVRCQRAGARAQGARADPADGAARRGPDPDGTAHVLTVRRQPYDEPRLRDRHLPAAGDQVPVELRAVTLAREHVVDPVADDVDVLAVHRPVGVADLDVAVAAVALAQHLERLGLPVAGHRDVARDQPDAVVTGVHDVEEAEDPVLVDRIEHGQLLGDLETAVLVDGEHRVVVVDPGHVGVGGSPAVPVGQRRDQHQSPENEQCEQPDQPSLHTRRLLTSPLDWRQTRRSGHDRPPRGAENGARV